MQFKEEKISSTTIYEGKIISVVKDAVKLPDGQSAIREVVHHSGGSAVIAELDDKILLVRQFRYPYQKEIWEIPAGKLNENELPEETAKRELEEEGGYKANSVKLLFEVYPTPAYDSEIIRIYKADGLTKTKTHLDDDEFLSSKWFSKDELREMMKTGEIKDAKTLIALLSVLKQEGQD